MKIIESDFTLEYLGGDLFDLRLVSVKKKKSGEIVKELGEPIYGCSLHSAIRRIISNRAKLKNTDKTLKKHLDVLIEQYKAIRAIFDGTPEEVDDGLE